MISHSFPSYDETVAKSAYENLLAGNYSARKINNKAKKSIEGFTGIKHAHLVSSGYAALQVSLLSLGVKSGVRVIIQNVTCPSVYHAIKSIGAIPHVVDVSNIKPLLNEEEIVNSYEADYIILTNMFGLKHDLNYSQIKGKYVIEDNAQSLYKGHNPNASVSICSFSPTKLLTVGYAGAVLTNHSHIQDRITKILDCDHINSYNDEEFFDFRIHSEISDFQSGMLIEQLKRYDQVIKYRGRIQEIYDEVIGAKRLDSEIPFRYQVYTDGNAKKLSKMLIDKGINAVPLGSHLLNKVFKLDGDFKNSGWWEDNLLSIPIHENISEDTAFFIANEVKKLI